MSPAYSNFMDRCLPSLVLLEWGHVFLQFVFGGRIAAYLHPLFRPFVLISGMLFIIGAIVCWGQSRCSDPCCQDSAERGGKTALIRRLFAYAILILPIAGAAAVSPDRFSIAFLESREIEQSGIKGAELAALLSAPTRPEAQEEEFQPFPDNEKPREISLLDLMLASRDEWCRKHFDGKRVQLIGRCARQDEHNFDLLCTVVTCCALDAQTYSVHVKTKKAPQAKDQGWVKLVGVARFFPAGDIKIPLITAESVTPIPAPSDPNFYQALTPSNTGD